MLCECVSLPFSFCCVKHCACNHFSHRLRRLWIECEGIAVSQIVVKQERVVPASPETVYALLADYKIQRPKLLTPNFLDYTVEKGGKGSGTVVSYRLHSANRERLYRMHIDGTSKGEVLTERDSNSSLVTTWSLFPVRGGALTRVRITTEWQGHGGVGGFFEKTFAPMGLRSIYSKMLDALVQQIPGASTRDIVYRRGQRI